MEAKCPAGAAGAGFAALLAIAGAFCGSPAGAAPVTFTAQERAAPSHPGAPAAGRPVPCRVHLKGPDTKPVQPPGLPSWKDHFVCPGTAELDLPPGTYTYEVERGPEYERAAGAFKVEGQGRLEVIVDLRRLGVDLRGEGWWPGELHVHRPVEDVELLMRAEDLYVAPVITWWGERNVWKDRAPPDDPLLRFDGPRFAHVLAGEDERAGGALMYFHMPRPADLPPSKRNIEAPSPMVFLTEARKRAAGAAGGGIPLHVDIEKPFWYDAPVWLASGMVDTVGIACNHMNRSGVYPDEAWGRARDKAKYPPPLGNGYWTQEIYYRALDCGLRVPPSAGSASGVLPNPVGYNRVYVRLDGDLTYEKWWDGLRAGRSFVTNGPLLRVRANGELPGHVFTAAAGGEAVVDLEADLVSNDPISALEVVRDGRIERTAFAAAPGESRRGRVATLRFKESGWFLVRAIADVPYTFRFASTAPWYVEVGDAKRRVSRASARFFLDWVRERMARVKVDDPAQREEVLKYHRDAEAFWQRRIEEANAE